jgi:hypothetical protein
MLVVLRLMTYLVCASPSATMDIPAPSWAGTSLSSLSINLDGTSTLKVGQNDGYSDGEENDLGQRRRISGPALMIGGAVLTGLGAIMFATAPKTGWNEEDTPHQAGSVAGVGLLLGGVILMCYGLVFTISD